MSESRATNAESYILDSELAAQLSVNCEIFGQTNYRTSPINRTHKARAIGVYHECMRYIPVDYY